LLKVILLEIELERWGDHAIRVYPYKLAMKGTWKNKNEFVILKT
jgi:hypothetical protein